MAFTSSRGNGTSVLTDDPPGVLDRQPKSRLPGQPLFESSSPLPGSPSAKLEALLAADLVDLRRVSDAIRLQPGFEKLVMRLSASLALSPDISPATVEEAAVVLGTDRLRVLVYAWSLLPQDAGHPSLSLALAPSDADPRDSTAASSGTPVSTSPPADEWTPEALYLASFLRWLGLDSLDRPAHGARGAIGPSGIAREQLGGLTDILLRDFMALIPFVEPALLKPRQRAALEGLGRSRKEDEA